MARTINPTEHATRRNEILNVFERLIYTYGYDHVAIQDVLNELAISKGAFYHYFGSKQALLEALIERMLEQSTQILAQVAAEPGLSTLEKLQRAFDMIGRWKTDQKAYLFEVLKIWRADQNALMRQKVQAATIRQTGAWFNQIIAQGVAEGVLNTRFPGEIGGLVMALLLNLGEHFLELLLSTEPSDQIFAQVQRLVVAHNDALERLLGAPPGSLHLVDDVSLHEWLATPRETRSA